MFQNPLRFDLITFYVLPDTLFHYPLLACNLSLFTYQMRSESTTAFMDGITTWVQIEPYILQIRSDDDILFDRFHD